jgi:glutamate synthase (NADPH) small chain
MSEIVNPPKKKRRTEMAKPHFLPRELRIGNFHEVNLGYLSMGEINIEADRCYDCRKPKCVDACPAHFNINDMLSDIRNRDYQSAADRVNDFYCTPSSFNRICPAFCQDACIAGKKGDPVQILNVKRFLADNFAKPSSFYHREELNGMKVAVIGSGPAGLTVAHELAKEGYEVSIFERGMLGGMLAVGIPEYRLDNNLLHSEIRDLEKLGIRIMEGKSYGKDFNYKDLMDQGYHAVMVAIGAHKPKFMKIPGEDLEGHYHAIDYLRRITYGEKNIVGKNVVVIGGGDVAIDAVRVSARLGAKSQIVYRRSLEEMPATKGEIHETMVEQIPINFLTNPVEILGENGKVVGVKVIKMELGEPDESGRRRPQPIERSEHIIPCDTVIQAISQEPENEVFKKDNFEMSKWNTFNVDEETMMTNIPGVFASGDGVSGPATAIEAIAQAKKAAKGIDSYLKTKQVSLKPGELF